MSSGIGTMSSMVFAQNDSEDSETDLGNMTLTNSSEVEVQVGSSGAELPQQQPQGPIPPAPAEQQPQGPIPPAPAEQQPQGPLSSLP